MILLQPSEYFQLLAPLEKVAINHFFAKSVLLQHIHGEVYADCAENPKTFFVVHPYGMGLLFGDWENEVFNAQFRNFALEIDRKRNKTIWLQAFPNEWNKVLDELFNGYWGTKIQMNTRMNFSFDKEKFLSEPAIPLPHHVEIKKTDKKAFEQMKGSVVPEYLWKNAEHFEKKGIGFSVYENGQFATTAFACFIHEPYLEIGIETQPEFQGKGYAKLACSALIDYCLELKMIPVWACRKENYKSLELAKKLGFIPTFELPFYGLMQSS
ncbi:MAG: GNAT family N-acetyltransferase [Cloacibacterium sp.]|nr:GNAT family N-acetyltransferase [Cloacibacterium sp.]